MLDDISALHISTAGIAHAMDSTSDADACSLSSLDSESDLSLAFERDLDEPADCDELPAFEIRAYSPHGRTPSPIDDLNVSDIETPKQQQAAQQQRSPERQNNPEFVALHEINAQISAPSENGNDSTTGVISHDNSLETIFEGVFLHTPPREKLNKSAGCSNSNSATRYTPKRSRVNLMELVAMNRLNIDGKENQSPCNQLQDEHT
ncbi:uncharacterized protein LOC6556643 [Drosophila grimshawi]|uniref:uncharacterized protein LOC6556643 n=1 Tax=Drosophila grimshawi TaxID=7222 RepID=UPI000C86EC59|nr:uncharacterized protein LOC6556643 [Drosophila grimshawi]